MATVQRRAKHQPRGRRPLKQRVCVIDHTAIVDGEETVRIKYEGREWWARSSAFNGRKGMRRFLRDNPIHEAVRELRHFERGAEEGLVKAVLDIATVDHKRLTTQDRGEIRLVFGSEIAEAFEAARLGQLARSGQKQRLESRPQM